MKTANKPDIYETQKIAITICDERMPLIERRYLAPDGESYGKPYYYLKSSDFVVTLGLATGDQYFIRPILDGPASNNPLHRKFSPRTRSEIGKAFLMLVFGQKGMI